MLKVGGSIKTWKLRYFILTTDRLKYYKAPGVTSFCFQLLVVTCTKVEKFSLGQGEEGRGAAAKVRGNHCREGRRLPQTARMVTATSWCTLLHKISVTQCTEVTSKPCVSIV